MADDEDGLPSKKLTRRRKHLLRTQLDDDSQSEDDKANVSEKDLDVHFGLTLPPADLEYDNGLSYMDTDLDCSHQRPRGHSFNDPAASSNVPRSTTLPSAAERCSPGDTLHHPQSFGASSFSPRPSLIGPRGHSFNDPAASSNVPRSTTLPSAAEGCSPGDTLQHPQSFGASSFSPGPSLIDGDQLPGISSDEIEGYLPEVDQDTDPELSHEDFSWIHMPVDFDDDVAPEHQDLPLAALQNVESNFTFLEDLAVEDTSVKDTSVEDTLGHQDTVTVASAVTMPLYEGAHITKLESLTAILSFAQSENISSSGLRRLLSLIDLHLPTPNISIKSNYELYKLLGGREPVAVYYFCSICFRHRLTALDLCDVCTDEKRSVHYFVSLPLVPQVKTLFKRAGFVEDIRYKSRRVKLNPNNVEDIYDGQLYMEAENTILGVDTNISLMWNTDGVQIFNSSSYSLWPWYFVINELPPEKRFLSHNMLLAGVWGGLTKPHPNIYLQPIFHDVSTLKNGVDVQFHGDDALHKVHAIVLCGTCDAPARALFLNMKSHSGFYSCHICRCRGEKSYRTGDVTVFPFEEHIPLRNLHEYKDQVKWAVDNRVIYNKILSNEEACSGIKGPTLLSYLVSDLFASTAIDSMHCVYLGVMRQMLHLWFDSAHKLEPFSLFSQIKTVSSRLENLTPPHFIQRQPQSIEKLIYWKASELRAFLFYLSLCVLFGILSPEYFSHFVLFVHGVALLNSSSVSQEDIALSKLLLCEFVAQYQVLYGLRHMSHNIHMLLHLGSSVQKLGPLWITSCFPFENMNGKLTNLIHGTRHAGLQIHSHLSVIRDLPLIVNGLREGKVKDYCRKLNTKWMQLKVTFKISKGVYCIGVTACLSDSNRWILDILVEKGVAQPDIFVVNLFHRLLKNGLLYVAVSYGRGERQSSYVKYRSVLDNTVKYGNVECFARVKNCNCVVDDCPCLIHHVAIIRTLHLSFPFTNHNVALPCVFQCQDLNGIGIDVVPVDALELVMYKVEVAANFYLCEPLNKFEME